MKKLINLIIPSFIGIGIGMFCGLFFSPPPSRAEFDVVKEKVINNKEILSEIRHEVKEIRGDVKKILLKK